MTDKNRPDSLNSDYGTDNLQGIEQSAEEDDDCIFDWPI